MSDINNSMEEEIVKNDMKHSPSSHSSNATSSEEELPVPRPQASSSTLMASPITTTSQLSMSYRTENESDGVTLPYPLRLDPEYIYRLGLKSDEFIHYCQSEQMKLMLDDPMDVIDGFIQDRLKKGLDVGVNQECLDHLKNIGQTYTNDESFEYYVYDYIEAQIFKLIPSPNFESPPDNQWSRIPFPMFNTSTLEVASRDLNIYPKRNNFIRRTRDNLNVFDLLALSQNESNENIRLYHGTDIESVKKICQYGINFYASHRLGSDFGPGFYVTDNFDDAVYVAAAKGARTNLLGGIICFQFREAELCQFNIQQLNEAAEPSTDPLEWTNFVKLCRRRFIEYPHMFRRDAFHGPICNNAQNVRTIENERPRVKIIDNRKPTQICIKSSSMAAKLECSILGVYMVGITSP